MPERAAWVQELGANIIKSIEIDEHGPLGNFNIRVLNDTKVTPTPTRKRKNKHRFKLSK